MSGLIYPGGTVQVRKLRKGEDTRPLDGDGPNDPADPYAEIRAELRDKLSRAALEMRAEQGCVGDECDGCPECSLCECDLELTINELDSGRCACCGKEIL